MENNRSFLGRGWAFPPEFGFSSKTVHMVSEEEDIRQSLHILLSTTPGERVMQHAYGCNLHALIFENISATTITEIKDAIERAVLFFEPRITLTGIDVDASEVLNGLIRVELFYVVRTTNNRSNMVYPFYFKEGTRIQF